MIYRRDAKKGEATYSPKSHSAPHFVGHYVEGMEEWASWYCFNKKEDGTYEAELDEAWDEGSHYGGGTIDVDIPKDWFAISYDEFLERVITLAAATHYGFTVDDLKGKEGLKEFLDLQDNMKKVLFIILAATLMLNCGNKTGNSVSNTDSLAVDSMVADAGIDKHSEVYIRQRIDTIYKGVGKSTYDSEGREIDYIHSPFNRDSAYCSERYYALMKEALEICSETGEILYDYDYWVCGQDFSDDWSCRVAKVYEITDSTALVDLMIHNFNDIETTIALRFERDDWYIDDFTPESDDKEYLRETIRQGLKIREQAKALVGYWGWVGDKGPELLLRLEMNGKGLEVTECNIYRLYGFDKATATFNGTDLSVDELEYDEEDEKLNHEFHFSAHLDKNGDLTGDCRIRHPIASRNYEGPLTLRKGYFKYRDGAKRNLSDYAE